MKKIFTLIALFISATALLSAESLIVSAANATTADAATWSFNNGCSITNASSKGYSTGTVNGTGYIKFSRNVVFTMVLPAGFTVNSIDLEGYDNYTDIESYLYEVNGDTLSTTACAFPVKNPDAVITNRSVTLTHPATGSFTFQFKGQQTVVNFVLNSGTTGISTPSANNALKMDEIVDVYAIDGRLVKSQIRCGLALNELDNGIYIINNKKMVINRIR